MRRVKGLSLLVCLMLFVTGCLRAPEGYGTIQGQIIASDWDEEGLAEGMLLSLTNVGSSRTITTRPSAEGNFLFKGVPAGEYRIQIAGSAWGRSPRFVVLPDEVRQVNVPTMTGIIDSIVFDSPIDTTRWTLTPDTVIDTRQEIMWSTGVEGDFTVHGLRMNDAWLQEPAGFLIDFEFRSLDKTMRSANVNLYNSSGNPVQLMVHQVGVWAVIGGEWLAPPADAVIETDRWYHATLHFAPDGVSVLYTDLETNTVAFERTYPISLELNGVQLEFGDFHTASTQWRNIVISKP